MTPVWRRLLPALLLGLLLLANLSPWGAKEAPPPTPAPPPEDDGVSVTYPSLPGRLIFRQGDELQILERGTVRTLPLPGGFLLPEEPGSAFWSYGTWVAGFVKRGEAHYLNVIDLASGAATGFGTTEPGQIAWSPETKQLAVWSANVLRLFSFNQGDGQVVVEEGARIGQVAWAPNGEQFAIAVTPPGGLPHIEVYQLSNPEGVQRIDNAGTPFWAPNGDGLVYVRSTQTEGPASELVLRKDDGQELILATVAQLLQANPEVAAIEGAIPSIGKIQGGRAPGELLFDLKLYSNINPRFAIGQLALPDGLPKLHLLPAFPDDPRNQNHRPPGPCYPGGIYPGQLATLLFVAEGIGCGGRLGQIDGESLKLLPFQAGLLSPDGAYVLQQDAPGVMPTVTRIADGRQRVVPLYGQPLHWDAGN